MDKKERPSGITILAIFNILSGLAFLLVLIAGRGTSVTIFDKIFSYEIHILFVVIIIVFSFVIAYGLLNGLLWAWYFTLLFSLFGFITSFIDIISYGKFVYVLQAVWYVFLLYYLSRPSIRAFFKKTS